MPINLLDVMQEVNAPLMGPRVQGLPGVELAEKEQRQQQLLRKKEEEEQRTVAIGSLNNLTARLDQARSNPMYYTRLFQTYTSVPEIQQLISGYYPGGSQRFLTDFSPQNVLPSPQELQQQELDTKKRSLSVAKELQPQVLEMENAQALSRSKFANSPAALEQDRLTRSNELDTAMALRDKTSQLENRVALDRALFEESDEMVNLANKAAQNRGTQAGLAAAAQERALAESEKNLSPDVASYRKKKLEAENIQKGSERAAALKDRAYTRMMEARPKYLGAYDSLQSSLVQFSKQKKDQGDLERLGFFSPDLIASLEKTEFVRSGNSLSSLLRDYKASINPIAYVYLEDGNPESKLLADAALRSEDIYYSQAMEALSKDQPELITIRPKNKGGEEQPSLLERLEQTSAGLQQSISDSRTPGVRYQIVKYYLDNWSKLDTKKITSNKKWYEFWK